VDYVFDEKKREMREVQGNVLYINRKAKYLFFREDGSSREQSSNLLLAFASTVILGFGLHDSIICSFSLRFNSVLLW
jgi:hypothetical protein